MFSFHESKPGTGTRHLILADDTFHMWFCVLKCYKNEHSFEICHWTWFSKLSCKISRRYDQPFSIKWRLKLLFLVIFRIFPSQNFHFRRSIWTTGCDVVRLYVLQSYCSCTFCKHKTRGERQFWIKLAAPCTLANHNEINSDDTLHFIIFLTPALVMTRIASGINACCYRHVPYDVINKH